MDFDIKTFDFYMKIIAATMNMQEIENRFGVKVMMWKITCANGSTHSFIKRTDSRYIFI